jgi:iron-sulfur cluster assembly protein
MVDEKSAVMLEGSVLEYHNTIERQGFEVQNPQATGCCGCGKSFSC